MDSEKSKILMLVEGAKTDVKLMKKLLSKYGIDSNHEIISYNTNIYELYREMFNDGDPSSMDILQVLKSKDKSQGDKSIFDYHYSDIILILFLYLILILRIICSPLTKYQKCWIILWNRQIWESFI